MRFWKKSSEGEPSDEEWTTDDLEKIVGKDFLDSDLSAFQRGEKESKGDPWAGFETDPW